MLVSLPPKNFLASSYMSCNLSLVKKIKDYWYVILLLSNYDGNIIFDKCEYACFVCQLGNSGAN
jgi:hypothetical protein